MLSPAIRLQSAFKDTDGLFVLYYHFLMRPPFDD